LKDRRVNTFKANNFQGMNNIAVKNKGSLDIPSMILNANVEPDGSLQKRPGLEKVINLPGAHSLWTNNKGIVLCMAQGVVYRVIDTATTVSLVDTALPDSPMAYFEVDGRVYMSNKDWTGMYDPSQDLMKAWGEPIPEAPILIPTAGSLPAGNYRVCVTALSEYSRVSGNSNQTGIVLDAPGGIEIPNLPATASVWITDPNGSIFLFAGSSSPITDVPENSEPIPSMWGSPPLPMNHLCWAFGRAWGCVGNRVYYSEPYQPELFLLNTNFFDLSEPVLMIARAKAGLFIGCESKTELFAGTDPNQMSQQSVGPGVVPGSLSYANDLGDLGRDVPIWVGKDGVYAGLGDGRAVNLIKEKVQIDPQQVTGASVCRVKDGRRQMLFSARQNMKGQEVGFGDNASCEVIRKGAVI
jgi:hypothetical protein